MSSLKDILITILLVLVFIGLGFLLGRCSKEEVVNTITEYIPSEPIHDSIPYPVPEIVIPPIDTCSIIQECILKGIYQDLFPTKEIVKDSIVYIPESDTTEIVMDWATKRIYKETLFDDSKLGKLLVTADVQYNRLMNLKYNYDPIKQVVTDKVIYTPLISPYVGASYGTFNTISLRAGTYFKESVGIEYQFMHSLDLQRTFHLVGVNYKF